jgi:DNA repair protein RadA/Sms
MAKPSHHYVCQSCGASYGRWQGKCDACNEWNSLSQESLAAEGRGLGAATTAALKSGSKRAGITLESLEGSTADAPRIRTDINELDRVTGGGFVPGSVLLLGGDPGIGKSTLLLQTAVTLASKGHRIIYISGEEASAQVRLRAQRLNLSNAPVELAAETQVEDIIATLAKGIKPALVIIDSIQTMWSQTADAAPGTVTQVRTSAQALIRFAKTYGVCVVLVGHVTKDGQIAGPRVVEHMVDAVMSFEGEAGHRFRLLRAVKNRFGPTDEIGVFDMTTQGLIEVSNPSALFLGDREKASPGSAVFAGLEGTRPLLVEIQALVAPTSFGTPRRAVVGWDQNRLAMVIAVLEARCGVRLGQHDVYLNIAGGLKVTEPAADMAVAAALVSSLSGQTLPATTAFFGEISLSGAVRAVAQAPARMKEAAKLGFEHAYIPTATDTKDAPLRLTTVTHLVDLVAEIMQKPKKNASA